MKLRSSIAWLLAAVIAALTPSIAVAHTVVGTAAEFAHGFVHPLTGVDHVLAMVAIGIVAYQIGGRALWLVPATFILSMAGGWALAISGATVPLVELGIALSVIVLGAAVVLGMRAPLAVIMGIVGVFAIFHGHAHGAEIPENASGLAYAFGFVGATGLLHLGGIGIGLLIGRVGERHEPALIRITGGLMTVAGVGILAGVL